MIMKVNILVHPAFELLAEVEKAVRVANRTQGYFELELRAVSWIEKKLKGRNVLDFGAVYQRKKDRLGASPTIVISRIPLKDNYLAWDAEGFYAISLGNWEVRHELPPIRTVLMYYIAGILPGFCSKFPPGADEGMYHEERPIGCISDTCPEGNDDVLLSMKGADICPDCTTIYTKYGCDSPALASVRKILDYVKEETARYDKQVPYDVFISYSHQDRLFVDRLVRDLEEHRLKVWRDGFRLLPGEGIAAKVFNGILTSKCLLCVLSRKSVKSPWVKRELEVAVTKSLERGTDRIVVLPTLIEECKVPEVLYGLYYVSFHDNYDLALNKVVAKVEQQRRQMYGRKKR